MSATPYHIQIAPIAYRQITALSPKNQKTLIKVLESLAINPRPPLSRKVEGMTGLYCENIHPLRILYKIDEHDILVLVVKSI